MNKLQKFKQVMTNPPPERLARAEYKSQFLQMIAMWLAMVILFTRGFWYVSLIFVFASVVMYIQAITSYRKWVLIASLTKPEDFKDFQKDPSPSRRRDKIIRYVFGSLPYWIAVIFAAIAPVFFLDYNHWFTYTLAYIFSIVLVFIVCYYLIAFWIANPVYRRKLRGKK